MALNCGIIGLPNVGKSTIFNAMVGGKAVVANYPFSTVDPNIGVAVVPDERLTRLTQIFKSKKTTPTVIEFRDIAGLVQGSSVGEGLGNQFLGQIREADALVHVVRCFANPDVMHVVGEVDPERDIGLIETELMLADLQTLERRREKLEKKVRAGEAGAAQEMAFLSGLIERLGKGEWLGGGTFSDAEQVWLREYQLLTAKPMVFAVNVGEGQEETPAVRRVAELAVARGARVVTIAGNIEAEVSTLAPDDRADYLRELGIGEGGLVRLVRTAYDLLGLVTFFTAGETESRAWTIREGTKAAQAAGKIHSDMERGFIRAEAYHYNDLIACGSEAGVKEKGLFRLEGRDYLIKDGDVLFFRFNV
ncbi:MAG: redox-regulated ATPase YchF [Nitrospirales bacterium]|nr:redox-regulated ATPase YchF [Nitrospirales bacterium]